MFAAHKCLTMEPPVSVYRSQRKDQFIFHYYILRINENQFPFSSSRIVNPICLSRLADVHALFKIFSHHKFKVQKLSKNI